jgi:hypothetical protein
MTAFVITKGVSSGSRGRGAEFCSEPALLDSVHCGGHLSLRREPGEAREQVRPRKSMKSCQQVAKNAAKVLHSAQFWSNEAESVSVFI